MFYAVIIALILFFTWVYFQFFVKPQFYDPKQFFINVFGEHVAEIRDEAVAVGSLPTLDILREREMWTGSANVLNFINKVDSVGPGWVSSWESKTNQWLNFPLMVDGRLFQQNAQQCPLTAKLLLQHREKINVAGFSLLEPNAKMPTHTDTTGIEFGSLAYHLGLEIPNDNCTLTVDGMTEKQQYGKQIVFDSTYPHSAANNSDRQRIILYIDFGV